MIAIANPTHYPGPAARLSRRKPMRRKKSHTRKHKNPTRTRRAHSRRRARVHHNPAGFARRRSAKKAGGVKDMLKEFLSMDGAFLIGGGVAGATVPTMLLNKFAPSLTGYGRILAKGAVGLGGAYLLAKFVHKKLGLGFGVTALASTASEAINLFQLGRAIPEAPASLQDAYAQNPGLIPVSGFSQLPSPFPLGPATLADGYGVGLSGGYEPALADSWT